jgi:lipoate---protein ligase
LTWSIVRTSGSAAAFHARVVPVPPIRTVWSFSVERAALVLGSSQPDGTIDREACERRGVDVVRRRSGGGAVLLLPGEVTWIDVIVPAGDPLWNDDIGQSMWWLGDVWAEVVRGAGLRDVDVHRGRMVTSVWSRIVCFAGIGPGEVTAGGRKVIGISQRRTRTEARFQCAVLRRWDPTEIVALLAAPRPTVEDLSTHVGVVDVEPLELTDAFLAVLAQR